MNRHHPRTKPCCRRDSPGNLMRDVVKFQIEKDPVALIDETAHERRAFGREQRAADFQSAHPALQPGGNFEGVHGIVDVEGN
jgi:hypothetical protein